MLQVEARCGEGWHGEARMGRHRGRLEDARAPARQRMGRTVRGMQAAREAKARAFILPVSVCVGCVGRATSGS